MPIHRVVYAMSLLALDKMYNDLVGPYTVVYGYNTDSMKLKNPLPFTPGDKPGDYQVEAKFGIPTVAEYSARPGWKHTAPMWNNLSVEESKNAACCLFTGMPGTGK